MMPQGYVNSPGIFQKAMLFVLDGLLGSSCLVYIDDIPIFCENIQEHDENCKLVEQRLMEYELEINFSKKQERLKEVIF